MTKYRVIKSWPDGPTVGIIFQKQYSQSYFEAKDYPWTFHKEKVESSPEFFASFLFQTVDGVDIYVYDDFYYIGDAEHINKTKCLFKGDGDFSKFKVFSTREAAEQYVASLRKPIWKTEDGEDVFDGDTVSWVICNYGSKQWEYAYDLSLDIRNLVCVQKSPEIYKVFKNKDKMNTGIEEMNRPKFVEGEWLLYKKGCEEWLFRFKSYTTDGDLNHKESYNIDSDTGKLYESKSGWFYNRNVIKADTDTIQRILSKVAVSKGFKEGVLVKSVFSGRIFSFKEKNGRCFYYPTQDELRDVIGGVIIYENGVWATIVENTIPEYVKLVGNIGSGGSGLMIEQTEFNDIEGTVYNTQTYKCDFGFCDDWKECLTKEYYKSNFILSTKAEYDLQEFKKNSKQVTVIVDGDVTSISSFGSEVKINYQIK